MLGSWICVGIVLAIIRYLAYKDTEISLERKELAKSWAELKKIEGQPESWLD